LQQRIKPGLNRGAIPLLARSIAKEIAHRDHPNGASEVAEAEDEHDGEADDEPDVRDDAERKAPPDLEADMHELQAELGEDWILRFSVQGDDAWLTAEKDDGSQHVEAPTASVLLDVVERLEDGSDRPT